MKIDLPDIEVTCIGSFECQQCYTGFLSLRSAVEHQQKISDNNGICQDKEVENAGSSE